MKRFILFALAHIFSVFALSLTVSAQVSDSPFPNYVVIGAFAHEKNAISFTDEAKHTRYPARFEMNPNRNLYYVYVLTTDDREYARAEALKLRAETKYFDAWVYSGVFGNVDVATLGLADEQHDFNPITGQRLEKVSAGEQQRSAAQGNLVAGATSDPRQTTETGRRIVKNDSSLPLDALATEENRSYQQSTSTKSEQTKTGRGNGEKSSDHLPRNENPIQQRDGNVNGSTRVANHQASVQSNSPGIESNRHQGEATNSRNTTLSPKQKGNIQVDPGVTTVEQPKPSLPPNPSKTHSNPASQRQADATAGRSSAEEQDTDGIPDRDGETPPVDDARLNNTTSQHRQTIEQPVTTTGGRTTVRLGAETSEGPGGTDEANGALDTDENREKAVNIPAPVRQSTAQLTSEEVVGKNFYFHLYRADNQKSVPGEVDAIDFEKSRKMGTYPANEGVKVTMAGGRMKHISFVCQVFGYRKQQQEFDPDSPSELLYLDDKGNLVVPFELVRLQKGDIAIMYNVFFFKDAAVMRPESRYEVNNLLDLLVENPSYKIMIHGHTNGNASGKIIRMDKPGNFYSLSGTKQGFGSAKQLSEERAVVIRDFLISSGISADRMQVKAWGGKKPIHDKHSVRAQENVRVEIEILSE